MPASDPSRTTLPMTVNKGPTVMPRDEIMAWCYIALMSWRSRECSLTSGHAPLAVQSSREVVRFARKCLQLSTSRSYGFTAPPSNDGGASYPPRFRPVWLGGQPPPRKSNPRAPLSHGGAFRFDSWLRLPRLAGMLIERMRKRRAVDRASFIEPCLPSPADKPPSLVQSPDRRTSRIGPGRRLPARRR
jgi:hypothetical protein